MSTSLSQFQMPKYQDIERYLKDPELLTAEVLFLVLTLSNVFIMFKLFQDVAPFPIFVTFYQLFSGLIMAFILGETGKEYPKLAYFAPVQISFSMMKQLLLPTCVYVAMLVLANVLLSLTQCVATYPVIVSLNVVMHHVTRFLGCGEEYFPMRWQSIGLLTLAFIIGCTDPYTVSLNVLPFALLSAAVSAAFRAGYLQKAIHLVEGRGNSLQNNQHALGCLILPIFIVLCGEYRVFLDLPTDPTSMHTYQVWGCLTTAGALPFLKNIVSNRLVRKTGQGPWRFLEISSVALVFLIGLAFGGPGFQGYISIILVIVGRSLGACDVMIAQSQMQNAETRGGGYSTELQENKPFQVTYINATELEGNRDCENTCESYFSHEDAAHAYEI